MTGGDAQQLRLVTCTGADAGGMQLAVLCGPWAALRYPRANVDVVTFGAAAWPSALNAPFAWAWQQLVTLHYLWPFELSAVQPNTSIDDAVLAMAAAVNPLITPDAVAQSIRVPNLPEFVPEQYADWAPGQQAMCITRTSYAVHGVGMQPPTAWSTLPMRRQCLRRAGGHALGAAALQQHAPRMHLVMHACSPGCLPVTLWCRGPFGRPCT